MMPVRSTSLLPFEERGIIMREHCGKGGFMVSCDNTFRAVYKTELDILLERTGFAKEFNNGSLQCCYCDRPISRETLHAIIPDNDSLKFCCNSSNCIISFVNESL